MTVVSQNALDRRRRRRAKTALEAENTRMKKIIALAERKAEHGCTDANCSLCHEEEGDGTWELST